MAILPLDPASKGKMETVTHSATRKVPVLALLAALLTSMQPGGLGLGIWRDRHLHQLRRYWQSAAGTTSLSLFITDGLCGAILGECSGIELAQRGRMGLNGLMLLPIHGGKRVWGTWVGMPGESHRLSSPLPPLGPTSGVLFTSQAQM